MSQPPLITLNLEIRTIFCMFVQELSWNLDCNTLILIKILIVVWRMKMWKINHIQASRQIIACRGGNRKGERWLSSWFIQAELPLWRTASAGGDEMYNVEILQRIIPYHRRQPSMDCVAPLDGGVVWCTLSHSSLTHTHPSIQWMFHRWELLKLKANTWWLRNVWCWWGPSASQKKRMLQHFSRVWR